MRALLLRVAEFEQRRWSCNTLWYSAAEVLTDSTARLAKYLALSEQRTILPSVVSASHCSNSACSFCIVGIRVWLAAIEVAPCTTGSTAIYNPSLALLWGQ